MSRKGFRRVSREQSRQATIRNLRGLRDTAVEYTRHALDAGDWATALACLRRAERYELQAREMEQGESAHPP